MNDITEILELVRLEELNKYHILNTPEDPFYDDVVHLVAQICYAPMAFISFMDEKELWLKAKLGIAAARIPKHLSICQFLIKQREIMIVPDLTKDARFKDNVFITDEPFFRFYAGLPLINQNGFALGTLCVLDVVPRDLTPAQIQSFQALQRVLVRELENRRLNEARWRFMDAMLKQEA